MKNSILRSTAIATGLMLSATAAFAQSGPDLSHIIKASVGYLNVGPGIILVEGDGEPNRFCAITISPTYIEDVSNGTVAPDAGFYDCFALEDTGNDSLSTLLDDSIGYLNLQPGVIIIEGENSSVMCSIDVPQAYLEARTNGNGVLERLNQPKTTCIPLASLEN